MKRSEIGLTDGLCVDHIVELNEKVKHEMS